MLVHAASHKVSRLRRAEVRAFDMAPFTHSLSCSVLPSYSSGPCINGAWWKIEWKNSGYQSWDFSWYFTCCSSVTIKTSFFEQNQFFFLFYKSGSFSEQNCHFILRSTKLCSCQVVKSETFNIDRERKFRFSFIMRW